MWSCHLDKEDQGRSRQWKVEVYLNIQMVVTSKLFSYSMELRGESREGGITWN